MIRSRHATGNFWVRLFLVVLGLCVGIAVKAQSSSDDIWWDSAIGNPGLNGPGYALAVHGDSVYVGGAFTSAGGVPAQGLARWDGTNWAAIGGGLFPTPTSLRAMAVYGGAVFVAGLMTNVFDTNGFNVPVTNIAAWNGSNWLALNGGTDGAVSVLAVHDGWLYAAGSFTNAGGVNARGIARWNGTNWTNVGGSVDGQVFSLAPRGTYLYAGGSFTQAGAVSAANFARWNGANWETFAGGVFGAVRDVAVSDSEVVVLHLPPADPRLKRWNGTSWEAPFPNIFPAEIAANNFLYFVQGGLSTWTGCGGLATPGSGLTRSAGGAATTFLALSGANLYATGNFDRAGGKPSFRIARWRAANAARFSAAGASISVGSSGTNYLQFTVKACPAPDEPVFMRYAITNGTAVPGVHYEAVTGTLMFTRFSATQSVSVPVFGRPAYFPSKTVNLFLETTNQILASTLSATASINSSLPAPRISISDASVIEGNTGTSHLDFTISLTAPVDDPLNVALQFADLTASYGVDYLRSVTNIVIPAGSTSEVVSLPVLPNTSRELDKQFRITVAATPFLQTNKGFAFGTILNDDTVPELRPALSVFAYEGFSTATSTFPVRLSAPVEQAVTVEYATANGSARAGQDFAAITGRLTFPPGVTTQWVQVAIFSDAVVESNETFFINFSNPLNATLAAAQSAVLIIKPEFFVPPEGFAASQVAVGLDRPTRMEFAPDGRLFVCEQAGALRLVRNGMVVPEPFLSLATNTTSGSERGLLGLAFDPDFASNQFLYVYYTWKGNGAGAFNRISRFTASNDTVVPDSELILQQFDFPAFGVHNGGDIHFGPDGKLYASVGEHGVRTNSQSFGTRLGKILRLNTDGTAPADNPFFSSVSDSNRVIWALGLRNPYSFAFQPGTGRMLINDVGDIPIEEINEGLAGANYGWAAAEGPSTNAEFQNPIFSYEAIAAAIIGAAFYNPAVTNFPAAYAGNYFFGDFVHGLIRRLTFTNGVQATSFASGFSSLVDLKVGPDGALYALLYSVQDGLGIPGGRIYRIFVPGLASRFEWIAPAGGGMELRVAGETGRTYFLETSTDLISWQRLTNLIAPASTFSIPVSASSPAQRFYRLTE